MCSMWFWFGCKVGEVSADQLEAVVGDLAEGRDYEFRVVPVNEAGAGEESMPSHIVKTKARRGTHVFLVNGSIILYDVLCIMQFCKAMCR